MFSVGNLIIPENVGKVKIIVHTGLDKVHHSLEKSNFQPKFLSVCKHSSKFSVRLKFKLGRETANSYSNYVDQKFTLYTKVAAVFLTVKVMSVVYCTRFFILSSFK